MTDSPAFKRQQLSLFDSTAPLRSAENVDQLPKTARALVEVIGIDATIDLVKMFGGDEFYLPEAVDGASKLWAALVEAMGRDATVKLVEAFGATRIYVPTCQAALLKLRNQEIVASYDAGEPFDAIRRRHRVSRSYLFRLLKKPA